MRSTYAYPTPDGDAEVWVSRHGYVFNLFVPPKYRGKGIARKLMEAVCNDADLTAETIHLKVEPFTGEGFGTGLSATKLAAFYLRLGFIQIGHLMVRTPQCPDVPLTKHFAYHGDGEWIGLTGC